MKKDIMKLMRPGSSEVVDVFDNLDMNQLKFKSKYLKYFFKVAATYSVSEEKTSSKKVALMGFNIPEELIIACGAKPVWIIGGSTEATLYGDSLLARDTDPAVKSAIGMMLSGEMPRLDEIDLVLIPVYSDSMRKVARILAKQFNTLTLDIPSVKGRATSVKRWCAQMLGLVEEISFITGKRPSKADLLHAAKKVSRAKKQLQRFVAHYVDIENLLTAEIFIMILNTYYMADDLEEWTLHLRALNDDIEKLSSGELLSFKALGSRSNIVLAGSSILFPNMKLPRLLTDAGLAISNFETEAFNHLLIDVELEKRLFFKDMVGDIARSYYENDTSQAFTNNSARMDSLQASIVAGDAEALIYHVIRGQVTVDFEFEKIENLFIKNGLPVLRVETDYNYQDIEQLRIRIEAFGEMIKSRKVNRKENRRIG
ncbi:MAG: hypothetical protein H6Q73_3 [Firmicutes bacterium]|nr:hypothetical protein [Bacillota bacterium]